MSILNDSSINDAYFFPQAIHCEDAVEVPVDGAVLRCFHHCPNPDQPTLIHFHGNGEAVAHYVQGGFPGLIHAGLGGINSLFIEYRGYGGSTGAVEMVSMLGDGQQVMEHFDIKPSRAIAYGRSIGSLYAIELARRCPDLAGLVIDSGIADIRNRFLDHPAVRETLAKMDMAEIESQIHLHFNHQRKIASYPGRLLLLHTTHDGLIGAENAELLYEWATTHQKEFREYSEGNHNTIFHNNRDDMLHAINRMAHELFPTIQPPSSVAPVCLDRFGRSGVTVFSTMGSALNQHNRDEIMDVHPPHTDIPAPAMKTSGLMAKLRKLWQRQ